MHLVCLDGWCELVAGSQSQLQHSTGKTGLPLTREWLDILGVNFLCKTSAKFAQLEISVVQIN